MLILFILLYEGHSIIKETVNFFFFNTIFPVNLRIYPFFNRMLINNYTLLIPVAKNSFCSRLCCFSNYIYSPSLPCNVTSRNTHTNEIWWKINTTSEPNFSLDLTAVQLFNVRRTRVIVISTSFLCVARRLCRLLIILLSLIHI